VRRSKARQSEFVLSSARKWLTKAFEFDYFWASQLETPASNALCRKKAER